METIAIIEIILYRDYREYIGAILGYWKRRKLLPIVIKGLYTYIRGIYWDNGKIMETIIYRVNKEHHRRHLTTPAEVLGMHFGYVCRLAQRFV